MSSQRISKIAEKLLKEDSRFKHLDSVSYGDLLMLHQIFEDAGMKNEISHPLNKHRSVLNALDRESRYSDAIFEKQFFRSFKGLARTFILKIKNNKVASLKQK
jgi:hypothetical protein